MLTHGRKLLRLIRLRECISVGWKCNRLILRPTFKLFKDGEEVDSLRGADPRALEEKIRQHYVVPEASGQGNTSEANHSVSSVSGYPDISSNIDTTNVHTCQCKANVNSWNA